MRTAHENKNRDDGCRSLKSTRKFRRIIADGLLLVALCAGALIGCNTPSTPPPVPAGTAYVADISQNDLLPYSVSNITGALTALPGSSIESGKYVYVSDEVSGIHSFSLNMMTGGLMEIAGSPFPAGNEPFGVALDPLGKFLYTANFVSNDVSGYTIDASTGKPMPVQGSPFAVGAFPAKAVVDPLGKFVYVPDSFDNTVRGFTIDRTTGALTTMPGSPFAATGAMDVLTIPRKGAA